MEIKACLTDDYYSRPSHAGGGLTDDYYSRPSHAGGVSREDGESQYRNRGTDSYRGRKPTIPENFTAKDICGIPSLEILERVLGWLVVASVTGGGWYGIIKGIKALFHWLL